MRNVAIGGAVAAAVIIAFVVGMSLDAPEPEGPAEAAGEALDEAVRDLGDAVDGAAD